MKENKKAVLLLCFNRPELTKLIIDSIIEYNPTRLYISCDGPRNDSDKQLIAKIIENINSKQNLLNCKLNLFTVNLGCKIAVKKGIDWFFEFENEGIILEDDCLPSKSFFLFTEELLERYRNLSEISMISGNNFGTNNSIYSYYFSKYTHIWGWATWKNRWSDYIIDENSDVYSKILEDYIENRSERKFWMDCFNKVYKEQFNTWDFQWVYTNFKYKRFSIMPSKNLVTNIGFSEIATHTKEINSYLSNLPRYDIQFPLNHPSKIEYNSIYDFNSKIMFGYQNNLILFKSIIKKIFYNIIKIY